jgi:hypothetical protein
MVEIRIGATIVNEITRYEALHEPNANTKEYTNMNARLWIDYDDLITDLKAIVENETYSDMKQALSDLINELEEIN